MTGPLFILLSGAPVSVTQSFSLLKSLYELSPILALMAIVIVYLGWWIYKIFEPEKGTIALKDKQLQDLLKTKDEQIRIIAEKKEAEIKELNEYIRENDKENLEVLSDIDHTLDVLIKSVEVGSEALREKIASETKDVKSHIDVKISELKEKIKNGNN